MAALNNYMAFTMETEEVGPQDEELKLRDTEVRELLADIYNCVISEHAF